MKWSYYGISTIGMVSFIVSTGLCGPFICRKGYLP